jgi:hypothetical protein
MGGLCILPSRETHLHPHLVSFAIAHLGIPIAHLQVGSPVKQGASAIKPGFMQPYLKPVVAAPRESPAEAEGSSVPAVQTPKMPFKPVMDYHDKGSLLL